MSRSKEYLDALVNAADLPDIISKLFSGTGAISGKPATIKAVWRGNHDTPSFSVFKKRNVWFYKDHGNASGRTEGNSFHFLTEIAGYEEEEAVKYLARETGIREDNFKITPREAREKIEFIQIGNKLDDEYLSQARKFISKEIVPEPLQGRGFTLADVTYNGYGCDEYGNALIPIFDPEANVVAVKARRPKDAKGARYFYKYGGENSPPKCNRGFSKAKNKDELYIIEGELNADILDSVMRENNEHLQIIGLAGNKANLYENVAKDRNVYIYLDSTNSKDFKKRKVALESQERFYNLLKEQGCKKIYELYSEGNDDFCDIASDSRVELFTIFTNLITDAKEIDYEMHPVLSVPMRSIYQLKDDLVSDRILYPTGFKDVDELSKGFAPYGTTLVCALSGHGKSTFLRQTALNLAVTQNLPVKFYSTEESVQNFIKAMADLYAGVSLNEIQKGYETPHLRKMGGKDEALERWKSSFDYYVSFGFRQVAVVKKDFLHEIKEDIERSYMSGQYGMFVVDYIQKVRDANGREDADEASMQLSSMASDMSLPIVLGVQLSKSKFDYMRASGVPVFTDIEGRGSIYQSCDNAWFLYSQSQYMQNFSMTNNDYRAYNHEDEGKSRFIQHKGRGKELGWKYLLWQKETQTLASQESQLIDSLRQRKKS